MSIPFNSPTASKKSAPTSRAGHSWLNGIFKRILPKGPNQMILPDDKEQSVNRCNFHTKQTPSYRELTQNPRDFDRVSARSQHRPFIHMEHSLILRSYGTMRRRYGLIETQILQLKKQPSPPLHRTSVWAQRRRHPLFRSW